MIDKAFC